MDYSNTKFSFLKEDCLRIFGAEKGKKVYIHSNKLLNKLLKEKDYVEHSIVRDHLVTHFFPLMSYYLTLKEFGYSEKESYKLSFKEIKKLGKERKKKNMQLVKIPFFYRFFKLIIKRHINKNWPKEYWKTEWIEKNDKEIHFKFYDCIYYELSKKYSCSELCKLFCVEDDISCSGYSSKIKFKRIKSIARGDKCCDFYFQKNK